MGETVVRTPFAPRSLTDVSGIAPGLYDRGDHGATRSPIER